MVTTATIFNNSCKASPSGRLEGLNPNNGTMNLQYSIPKEANAAINIYDIRGVLVSTKQLPTGENKILSIEENTLSAGVYFYKILVNNTIVANDKLIIIK